MKEFKKGLANHLETGSCDGDHEAALEALTGAYAGRGIELRNRQSGSRRCCPNRRQQGDARQGECVAARRSRSTPGMHRNTMRENRETPLPPGAERQQAGGRTR
jgi:hypothetical protein